MNDAGWDDLKLFLHVASEGGLSGAANRTGLSSPTIGRRMLALERATGRTLFVRSQRGYRLAPDGEVLLAHVKTMQETAEKIAGWRGHAFELPIVSLGADPWIAGFIASHTDDIRRPEDRFRLCMQRHHGGIDFTYREMDIALKRTRPESGNLAIRKSVEIAYAVYKRHGTEQTCSKWISLGTASAYAPADRWVFEHHEGEIHTWANAPELLLRLILAGNGRGVLPCFVGDAEPDLEREGGIIEDLTYTLWIVAHDDDRHRPEMRLVMDRLAALLKKNAEVLAGRTA